MLHKTITALLVAIQLLCQAGPARASLEIGSYRYCQDLTVTAADTYNIELNQEVLNNCREDMGDLRLADQQNGEIPYYLDLYTSLPDILTEAAIVNDDSADADFHQVVIDSQNDHTSHNGILVDIDGSRELSGNVLIEGSYNNIDYEDLAMNRLYARDGQTCSNELLYPIKKYRYLRLTLTGDDVAEMTFRRVQFLYRPPQDQSVILKSATLTNSYSDRAGNARNYIVDLGMKNLTVHNVLIQHSTTDFTRLVNIYDSNDGENWQPLAQNKRIFDYRWDEYSARNDSVEVNLNARRFLRVEILNDSDSQLDITGINVLGMVPRLTAALPAGRFRLYYGNPGDSAPEYGKQPPESSSQTSHPVLEAGPQNENPAFAETAGYVSQSRNNLVVNVVLLACFLAVAGILLRNIRRSIAGRR